MRRRLFWSLVAVAVAVLTVAGVAATVLINRSVDRSVRTEFARQAEATARLIESVEGFRAGPRGPGQGRQPVIDAERTLAGLLQVVRSVGGHEYVEAAYVASDGSVTPLLAEPLLIGEVPDLADLRERIQFDVTIDGGEVAALAVPVDVGGANSGDRGRVVVVIGTNLDLVPWTDVLVRFGRAVALGIVLAALIAARLSVWLVDRLRGLRAASVRLAGGDLGARVPIEGHDEVTDVAVAFNEMAEGLEGARRREREFLANISHDLRTPLTTIGGYAEAIHEGLVPDGELERVGGVIDRESNRLSRLVEDLMLLSRIEAREFTLRPEQVDLTGHLRGIVDAYKGKAVTAGISLESDLALLPTAEVDPDRIGQIVGNLVDNALRYTPDGGTVTVLLEALEGGMARIAVSDTGPGISADDLPHIFERLYVAQRYRATRPTGSGLGLAIVNELARAMGGRAAVESEVGAGTTVSVTVPVAPKEA